MVKKIAFGLALSILIAGGVSAIDFGKINSSLGPKSFTVDLYSGLFGNNGGANFEWVIGGLPITLGLGLSPFIIGEYALRAGYHPDLGVKGLDVYANLTLGIGNIFFIPIPYPVFGLHLGARYFFGPSFGVFGEFGWASTANYIKAGIAFKIV